MFLSPPLRGDSATLAQARSFGALAGGEERPRRIRKRGDRGRVKLLATGEHADLKPRAVRADRVDVRRRRRLHDPVDVDWRPPRVRPLAGVDLLGCDQAIDDLGGALQECPEFGGLRGGKFGDTSHVPTRHNEQRANAERPDAVLNEPVGRLVDDATREREPPFDEVAREAAVHVANTMTVSAETCGEPLVALVLSRHSGTLAQPSGAYPRIRPAAISPTAARPALARAKARAPDGVTPAPTPSLTGMFRIRGVARMSGLSPPRKATSPVMTPIRSPDTKSASDRRNTPTASRIPATSHPSAEKAMSWATNTLALAAVTPRV